MPRSPPRNGAARSNEHSEAERMDVQGRFYVHGVVPSSASQVIKRHRKEGICVTCGVIKTHRKTPLSVEPLTKKNEVYLGWCLRCHTMEEILKKPDVVARLEKKDKKKSAFAAFRGGRGKSGMGTVTESLNEIALSLPPDSTMQSPKEEKNARKKRIGLGDRDSGMNKTLPANFRIQAGDTLEPLTSRDSDTALPRGLGAILRDMKKDASPTGQSRYCHELSDLLYTRKDDLHGAIDATLHAMRSHPQNLNVQEGGCSALCTFSTDGGNRELPHGNAEIIADKSNCAYINKLSGIPIIISAMKVHQESAMAHHKGLRTIRNILNACGQACKHNIIDNGGLAVISSSMWLHENLSTVQEDGSLIFWSLMFKNDETKLQILANNGVGAILNGMTLHLSIETVQHHGCGALQALTTARDLIGEVLDNGMLNIIILSLTENGSSLQIAEAAFSTLANVMPEIKRGLSNEQLEVVLNVMQMHGDCVELQRDACLLLDAALQSGSNVNVLCQNPTLRFFLVDLLESYPHDSLEEFQTILQKMDEGLGV